MRMGVLSRGPREKLKKSETDMAPNPPRNLSLWDVQVLPLV